MPFTDNAKINIKDKSSFFQLLYASGVMPGKSQNAVLQLYSITMWFYIKMILNFAKIDWNYFQIIEKLGLRPQNQYIMTCCCRNSMEGALIQNIGQKAVSRITPDAYNNPPLVCNFIVLTCIVQSFVLYFSILFYIPCN